jgi:acetyl esterase/lipase
LSRALLLGVGEAGMPRPGGAVLISRWTYLTVSSPSYAALGDRDPIITHAGLRDAGLWYAGEEGDPADPRASPLFADLRGLPPLLIHVGGNETMLDDSRLLAERAEAAGVEVGYRMWPGLWHVFHHEHPEVPEAVEGMQAMAAFVRERLG